MEEHVVQVRRLVGFLNDISYWGIQVHPWCTTQSNGLGLARSSSVKNRGRFKREGHHILSNDKRQHSASMAS